MSENRAIVLYGINQYRLEKRERPSAGPGEIVVKVGVSGLCSSDVKTLRHGGFLVKYPVVLGHETAGTVVEVGSGVSEFSVGDKVTVAADVYCGTCEQCRSGRENLCERPMSFGYNIDGSHADYLLVPRPGVPKAVYRIPDDMSMELASMTEPFACVIHSMRTSGNSPGRRVAVVGDGPLGLMHVVASKIYGADEITVLGMVDEKLRLASKLGAHRTYNRKEYTNIEDVLKETSKFDIVYVTVVNERTLSEAMTMAKKGGRVVIFAGVPMNSVSFVLDPNTVHYGEVSLIGSYGYTYPEFYMSVNLLYQHREVLGIVSHRFDLWEFDKALKTWDDKDGSIKILIKR
ncbi:MAG: zinc-dependent alcohol dehydrogenase [Nitrososphaeria archaeon]